MGGCDCSALRSEMLTQRKLMIGWFEILLTELKDVKSELITKFDALNFGEREATTAQQLISDSSLIEPFSASVFLEKKHNALTGAETASNSNGAFELALNSERTQIAEAAVSRSNQNLVSPKIEPFDEEMPTEFVQPHVEHSELTLAGEQASFSGVGLINFNKTDPNKQTEAGSKGKEDVTAQQDSPNQRKKTVKIFRCEKCPYQTPYSSAIKNHAMIHSGEKPFACDICDYRCRKNSDLVRHKRYHTGEKRFKCDQCNYRCREKSNLRVHQKVHNRPTPLKCDLCDYRAAYKSNLKLHKKCKHGPEKLNLNYKSYP